MTAYNVVKFRAKPDQILEFEKRYTDISRDFEGLKKLVLIKTGDPQNYCAIGEWVSIADLENARPAMLENLKTFRDTLEEVHVGHVTEAVSGEAIYEIP